MFMAKNEMEMLDEIDRLILKIIKKEGSQTTYQIAKLADISWSTANTHCYKMQAIGVLKGRFEQEKIGARRKVVWRLIEGKE